MNEDAKSFLSGLIQFIIIAALVIYVIWLANSSKEKTGFPVGENQDHRIHPSSVCIDGVKYIKVTHGMTAKFNRNGNVELCGDSK